MSEKISHKRLRDETEQASGAPALHHVSNAHGEAALTPPETAAQAQIANASAVPVQCASPEVFCEHVAFILRAAHSSGKVAVMTRGVDYGALVACAHTFHVTDFKSPERLEAAQKKNDLSIHCHHKQFNSVWAFVDALLETGCGKATKEELAYVVGPVIDPQWEMIAQRLLHMCAFWVHDAHPLMSDKAHFPDMEDTPRYAAFHGQLVKSLILNPDACDKSKVERALESLEALHVLNGKTYYDLKFVATVEEAKSLLSRDIKPKRDHLGDVDLTKSIGTLLSGLMGTVAFTGETGSAKTSTALRCACGNIPTAAGKANVESGVSVAIYTTAVNLGLDGLEPSLKPRDDFGRDSKHAEEVRIQNCVSEHIASCLKTQFPVQAESSRAVAILVIDELGACPRAARALCQITQHTHLAKALKIKQVVVFAVGTGVDHALSKSVSKQYAYKHVRTKAFEAVHGAYVKNPALWKEVMDAFGGKGLPNGIFAKMLRLSCNARVAALLHANDVTRATALLLGELTKSSGEAGGPCAGRRF